MDKQSARPIIEKLLVIQSRDCDIARCRRELHDIPRLKQSAQDLMDKHSASLERAKESVRASLVALKQKEVEIEAMRQQVSKLRSQQFQIKSNEEFKLLNKEIANLEEKARFLEDSAIELMESAEKAKSEENDLKSRLDAEQENVNAEKRRLDERAKNLEQEIGQLQSDRDGMASEIPQEWMIPYERVIENRKDIALVCAENNCCGGCQMKLPPQLLQDAKRADAVVFCSFCGRLLYWNG